ncbi:MAG: hypothetical protein PHG82_02875 [Candidatus Gracilibacteria bacterium]|nr:hypothetical protein [Candidatus Gracilibacteria bacterium]
MTNRIEINGKVYESEGNINIVSINSGNEEKEIHIKGDNKKNINKTNSDILIEGNNYGKITSTNGNIDIGGNNKANVISTNGNIDIGGNNTNVITVTNGDIVTDGINDKGLISTINGNISVLDNKGKIITINGNINIGNYLHIKRERENVNISEREGGSIVILQGGVDSTICIDGKCTKSGDKLNNKDVIYLNKDLYFDFKNNRVVYKNKKFIINNTPDFKQSIKNICTFFRDDSGKFNIIFKEQKIIVDEKIKVESI